MDATKLKKVTANLKEKYPNAGIEKIEVKSELGQVADYCEVLIAAGSR